jgi:DnaJ-domain-containing protein 1
MHSQPKSETLSDSFAILGFDRNPWLDPQELKDRYVQRAKEAHPDHKIDTENSESESGQEAASINQAFKTLENSATRIAHFLILETGHDVTQDRNVPEELISLFMDLGPLFQQADQLIRKVKNETSQILRARHFIAASPLLTKLSNIQSGIVASLQSSEEKAKEVQKAWLNKELRQDPKSRKEILQALTKIYGTISFSQRWLDTINEKSFELTPC